MSMKMTPELPTKQAPRLCRSFACALAGIRCAILRERNLRIHLAVLAGVLYFARYYALSRLEWAVLLLAVGLVLCCELLNTALEHLVDFETRKRHPLAKTAKDIAAGAVLTASITGAVIGFFLFWDVPTFRLILRDVAARPLFPLILLALLLCAVFVKNAD